MGEFIVVVLGLQNAGAVIGKGGANIKRLRQDVSHCLYCSSMFCGLLYVCVKTVSECITLFTMQLLEH